MCVIDNDLFRTMRLTRFLYFSLVCTILLIVSCNTSKSIYRSSSSKKDYLEITAFTLSHCGCTDLYVDSYRNGKKEFQLFYTNNLARKSIYTYQAGQKLPDTLRLLATTSNDFSIAFDSIDIEVFRRIDSIAIKKPSGVVYAVKKTNYKGYIKDPLYN